jgi:hypothetical protein
VMYGNEHYIFVIGARDLVKTKEIYPFVRTRVVLSRDVNDLVS